MNKAERVVADFRAATKTISLAVLAKRAGAETDEDDGMIFYLFDDGSRIGTKGRGPSHQVWTYTAIPDESGDA